MTRVALPRLLALGASLALTGCTALAALTMARVPACDGPLLDSREIPGGDFLLRERVRVERGELELAFEVVAERREGRLVLVAWDRLGARAFSVVQQGLSTESDSPLGPALQIPPGNLLRDLHLARFQQADTPVRVTLSRPGCDYQVTFVRVERREL